MAFLTIWSRLWNKKHTSETQYRITSKNPREYLFVLLHKKVLFKF